MNRKRVHEFFAPGDIVYVRDLTLAQTAGGALKSKFIGPFIVEKVNKTRLECTLQSVKDRKRCIRHMTHLKKQEQLDDNNFVPANLEENNLTSDDINHDDDVEFVNVMHQDGDISPDPVRAADEVETELLYHDSESIEQAPSIGVGQVRQNSNDRSRNSDIGQNRNNDLGQKRKPSLDTVLPTRKLARIRPDDYSHTEVTV